MFGGNPGGKQGKEDKLRLGDFWKLHLKRPGRDEVLRKCKILIRQSKFSELAAQDSMVALRYLHTSLSSVVDHNNAQEEREVHLRVCNCVVLYVGSFQNCKLASSFFVLLIMKRPFAPNAFS